jgi:hypothetical protein
MITWIEFFYTSHYLLLIKGEIMNKIVKGFPPRKIKVTFDNNTIDVTLEKPKKSLDKGNWKEIWRVADVYVHEKGKVHTEPDNQVAKFPDWIAIEVVIPDKALKYFENNPDKKLYLVYYDKNKNDGKGEWVEFKNQPTAVADGKAVVILYDWIKDPPVGWGGL